MSIRRASVNVLDQFTLFIGDGPVRISGDGQTMLALLIASGPGGFRVDQASEQLWTGEPTGRQTSLVERNIAELQSLHHDLIEQVSDRFRLALPSNDVDLWWFFEQADDDEIDWSTSENLRLLKARSVFPHVQPTNMTQSMAARFHQVRRQVLARQEQLAGPITPIWWASVVASVTAAELADADDQAVDDLQVAIESELEVGALHPVLAAANEALMAEDSKRLVGRALHELLEPNETTPIMVVVGEPGAGKTRSLALMADDLNHRGRRIHYVNGDPESGPTGARRSSIDLRRAIAASLEYPVALVVDGLESLADGDVDTLLSLQEMPAAGGLVLIVAGIDDSAQMTRVRQNLIRGQSGVFLALEPLELTEVITLVGHHFPQASSVLRTALARDLQRRSFGNPGRIAALVASVSPGTLLVTNTTSGYGDRPHRDSSSGLSSSAIEARALKAATRQDYRRVVEILTTEVRDQSELDFELRMVLTEALHRSGAHEEARRLRISLVDEALACDDHQAALTAALIGVPEAERVEADGLRTDQLLSINPDRLNPDDRFRRANAIVRAATFLGRTELAAVWQERADDQSIAADQRAESAIGQWYSSIGDVQPAVRLRHTSGLLKSEALSDHWRARLLQIRAIDYYEDGRRTESIADCSLFGALAESLGDPLRRWHHLIFQTMVDFDDGRWERAHTTQVEALSHADQNALVEGQALYIAQSYHESWIKGENGAYAQIFDRLPPDMADSRLGRAAMVCSCDAADEPEQAASVARPLINDILHAPNQDSLPALALMSRYVGRSKDSDLIRTLAAVFAPRSGSSIVIGSGVACLGPVDRYLYQLTGDPHHLDRAIAIADQARLRLWQVKLRLESEPVDRAAAGFLRRQAEAIAADSDLMALLEPASTRTVG